MKILGIDTGGTKSVVALSDEKGNLISMGFGGPSNYRDVGMEGLRSSIEEALEDAGIREETFDIVIVGVAGMDFKESVKRYFEEFFSKMFKTRVAAFNDCYVALRGAIGTRKTGVTIVAGTGNMVIGVSKNGEIFRNGGWGHLFGDPGSAFGIAFDALKLAMKTWEGRAKAMRMTKLIEEVLGIKDVDDAIDYVHSMSSKAQLASLAPRIIEFSRSNHHAKEIVFRHVKDIVEKVRRVSRAVGSRYVSYSGGLFRSRVFKIMVKRELLKYGFSLKEPVFPPVGGALMIGAEILGLDVRGYSRKLKKEFI